MATLFPQEGEILYYIDQGSPKSSEIICVTNDQVLLENGAVFDRRDSDNNYLLFITLPPQ